MGDVTGSGEGLDVFWSFRPVLAHIRDYARARRVSPWAVLGNVLVRTVAAVPPRAVLPPLTGGVASLNLFVGVVGVSGDGKGAAERTAEEAVDLGNLRVAGVGSGEGLAHLFMRRDRKSGDLVQHSTAVILSVPEIDTLTALTTGRVGTTLLAELRKAWSGEALGFAYADPDKRLRVKPHTYRLCVVAGIQPGRAGPLVEAADAGAPQRFLWLPATDHDAPDQPPDLPANRWGWRQPVAPGSGHRVLDVPEVACATVDAHRLAQLRQTGDDTIDGHSLLCRLKVTGALAALDSRDKATDEDWMLAGVVMAVSSSTREQVVTHLRRTRASQNAARGHAEADRALIVDERVEETKIKRVCNGILRTLRRVEDNRWATRSELRRSVASYDRGWFNPALARLIDAGQVEAGDGDRPDQLPGGPGDKYRLTQETTR